MSQDGSDRRDARLEEILAAYLEALEAGESPDREELLAQHPEYADELRSFLDGHERMRELAEPLTLPLSDTPAVGERIRYFGDYELLEEIARGGMGVIYKARQVSLDRVVAVKMLLSGPHAGKEETARFRAEGESAARLDHPAIVPIYEVGEHDGRQYLAMRYVEGQDLAHRIQENPLSPREAVTYVEQVASAIHYAHQRGILHRDLKPSNVIVDADDQVHVTDFGLAKRVDADRDLTTTGQVLGTPSYMPPEQAAGRKELGPRADVYSLGAILYALVTGRPPFQAPNALETLRQVLEPSVVPASPRSLNSTLPADLETIVLKCLDKDPDRRYQTAQELADDLGRFQRDEPILARPIGRGERALRWCRRNPVIAILTAAVAVLLLLVATVSLVAYLRTASALRGEAAARAEAEAQKLVAEEGRERAEAEHLRAERHLHAARLNLAQRAWEDGDLNRMYRSLEGSLPQPGAPDLRGFAWGNLWQRGWTGHETVSTGITDDAGRNVSAIPFALTYVDGERLLVHSTRNRVVLLEPDGRLRRALPILEEGDGLTAAAPSRDGRWVAAVCRSGALVIWDAATGELLRRDDGAAASALAFAPDGSSLAVGGKNGVTIEQPVSGEVVQTLSEPGFKVTYVAFSQDGAQLAAADTISGRAVAWNLPEGTRRLDVPGGLMFAFTTSIAFSPDGRRLAIARRSDGGTIQVVSLDHPDEPLEIRLPWGAATDLAFTPDSNDLLAAIGGDRGQVVRISADTGEVVHRYRAHFGAVTALAVGSEDFVSAGMDNTLRRFPLELPHPRLTSATMARYLPGGELLALTNQPHAALQRWNADRTEPVWTVSLSGVGQHLDLARDGSVAAFATEGLELQLVIVDTDTGQAHRIESAKRFQDVAVSARGTLVATVDIDGVVGIRDGATGEPHPGPTGDFEARGLLFLTDDTLVVTTREDVRVFTSPYTETSFTVQAGRGSMALSPDGTRLAIVGREIELRDAKTFELIDRLAGHGTSVQALAFHPDGRTLAIASAEPSIQLWDVTTGLDTLRLAGGGPFQDLDFSPDGLELLGLEREFIGTRLHFWKSVKPTEAVPPPGFWSRLVPPPGARVSQ